MQYNAFKHKFSCVYEHRVYRCGLIDTLFFIMLYQFILGTNHLCYNNSSLEIPSTSVNKL